MLIETIRADLTEAMKAKEPTKVQTLRSVISAVQEAETGGAGRIELDDDGVQKVIAAQAKMRVEAAEAFQSGGRDELEAKERAELVILEKYLPAQLSDGEVEAIVDRVLADNGFDSMKDMGAAMKAVKAEVDGQADGAMVAGLVKTKLAGTA